MPGAASSVRRQWPGEFCQGRPEDRHAPAILILLHMNQDFANVRKRFAQDCWLRRSCEDPNARCLIGRFVVCRFDS